MDEREMAFDLFIKGALQREYSDVGNGGDVEEREPPCGD